MPRLATKTALTVKGIEAVKPPATGQAEHPDSKARGLVLRVSVGGTRAWVFRGRDGEGKQRRFTLGSFPEMSLEAARDAARNKAAKLAGGWTPEREEAARQAELQAAEREAAAKAEQNKLTLGVLVKDWRRLKLASRTPRYATEAERALARAFASQWDKPAADLDRRMVASVLADLRPVMGNRVQAYGRACFQWAVARELTGSDPFTGHDVAPVAKRDRVLDDAELADVWRATLDETGVFGPIVRLLILTGQRVQEVAAMNWTELSLDLTTWTILGERTKNGQPSIVPLSALAQAQLPATHGKELVFPGQGAKHAQYQGWSNGTERLAARINKGRAKAGQAPMPGWRLHDLRRTLATGLQRLGVRLEVTEAVLNHTSGSRAGIVGIYQRHTWADEKRQALDAWAQHVARVVAGKPADTGNVVAFPVAV